MGRPSGPTRDTKRLICERALEVFAEKGYAATTMRDTPAPLMGAASGVYNTSRQVGSVIGVSAVSAVVQSVEGSGGMANSLFVIVAALVVGLIASLFFRDTLAAAAR